VILLTLAYALRGTLIRATRPRSVRSSQETVRMGILHPHAPFLRKPFSPGTLTRAVERLLERRRAPRELAL